MLDFANTTQRAAGISLSASEYLQAEGLNAVALNIAGAVSQSATPQDRADINRDGAINGSVAEFERLVSGASADYKAWSQGDYEQDMPASVKALAQWIETSGGRAEYHLPRLAGQLGWTSAQQQSTDLLERVECLGDFAGRMSQRDRELYVDGQGGKEVKLRINGDFDGGLTVMGEGVRMDIEGNVAGRVMVDYGAQVKVLGNVGEQAFAGQDALLEVKGEVAGETWTHKNGVLSSGSEGLTI